MGEWIIVVYACEKDSMHRIWRTLYENEEFTGRWSEDADTGEIRIELKETHKLGLFSIPRTTIIWVHESNIGLRRVLECNQKEI